MTNVWRVSEMSLFIDETAADQLFRGLCLLVTGLLIAPYLSAWLVGAVEKMNGATFGSFGENQIRAFSLMRHFFAYAAAAFAALGAGRLAIYIAVKSGLIPTPWGLSA